MNVHLLCTINYTKNSMHSCYVNSENKLNFKVGCVSIKFENRLSIFCKWQLSKQLLNAVAYIQVLNLYVNKYVYNYLFVKFRLKNIISHIYPHIYMGGGGLNGNLNRLQLYHGIKY